MLGAVTLVLVVFGTKGQGIQPAEKLRRGKKTEKCEQQNMPENGKPIRTVRGTIERMGEPFKHKVSIKAAPGSLQLGRSMIG